MILTHESGAQEDQLDEKNGGKKSRDTIPLNSPKESSLVLGHISRFSIGSESDNIFVT